MADQNTFVRSTCPQCGTVDMPVAAITVFTTDAHAPRYRYRCPLCRADVERDTTRSAVALLHEAGARVVPLSCPEGFRTIRPACPGSRHDPLTDAEVDEFVRALDRTDDVVAAAWPGPE
ncbi:MAG TPA: hypothetical protein VHC41_07145 [Mycobacteriales bacterium]|nr:hypothetical protein [Mycobacteriales bacterium]